MSEFELNMMSENIINHYGTTIDNMSTLKGLTDAIFVDAEKMFKTQLKFFIFTCVVPFIAHFFVSDIYY
jgi:hypothetical protein